MQIVTEISGSDVKGVLLCPFVFQCKSLLELLPGSGVEDGLPSPGSGGKRVLLFTFVSNTRLVTLSGKNCFFSA